MKVAYLMLELHFHPLHHYQVLCITKVTFHSFSNKNSPSPYKCRGIPSLWLGSMESWASSKVTGTLCPLSLSMALGETERDLLRLLVLCLLREGLENWWSWWVLGSKGGLLESRGLLRTIGLLIMSSVRLQRQEHVVKKKCRNGLVSNLRLLDDIIVIWG